MRDNCLSSKRPMPFMEDKNDLATLVIQHRVNPSATHDYESWLMKAAREGQRFKGHLGASVIRPSGDGPYTIVVRFEAQDMLSRWIGSEARKRLVQEVQSFLQTAEHLEMQTGPAYWFTPQSAKPARPKPIKQFLVSLGAIYPLIVVVPWALQPLFTTASFLAHPLAGKFMTAVVVVFLMVYIVMPRCMRWWGAWLCK
jgi:antibiotic biosynthesis monooxygenase (ABM) superfamily enzyme